LDAISLRIGRAFHATNPITAAINARAAGQESPTALIIVAMSSALTTRLLPGNHLGQPLNSSQPATRHVEVSLPDVTRNSSPVTILNLRLQQRPHLINGSLSLARIPQNGILVPVAQAHKKPRPATLGSTLRPVARRVINEVPRLLNRTATLSVSPTMLLKDRNSLYPARVIEVTHPAEIVNVNREPPTMVTLTGWGRVPHTREHVRHTIPIAANPFTGFGLPVPLRVKRDLFSLSAHPTPHREPNTRDSQHLVISATPRVRRINTEERARGALNGCQQHGRHL